MDVLFFYQKPGCVSNSKQKKLLLKAGIKCEPVDILEYPWTMDTLKSFFTDGKAENWINPNAPRVKSGEIIPSSLNQVSALELMLADPLLIRRPLIECHAGKWAGFDLARIASAMGIEGSFESSPDIEHCSHPESSEKKVPKCP